VALGSDLNNFGVAARCNGVPGNEPSIAEIPNAELVEDPVAWQALTLDAAVPVYVAHRFACGRS
jgi:hypothetical protein